MAEGGEPGSGDGEHGKHAGRGEDGSGEPASAAAAPASRPPARVTAWLLSRQEAVTRPSTGRGTRTWRRDRLVTLAATMAQV